MYMYTRLMFIFVNEIVSLHVILQLSHYFLLTLVALLVSIRPSETKLYFECIERLYNTAELLLVIKLIAVLGVLGEPIYVISNYNVINYLLFSSLMGISQNNIFFCVF